MAARNTISRLTSRIEDLAERRLPRRGPVTIVGADEAECRTRLKEIEAAGQRPAHVRFIMTGVPRSDRYRSGSKMAHALAAPDKATSCETAPAGSATLMTGGP